MTGMTEIRGMTEIIRMPKRTRDDWVIRMTRDD